MSDRRAGVEITEAMIRAGENALLGKYETDEIPGASRELVQDVFLAMLAVGDGRRATQRGSKASTRGNFGGSPLAIAPSFRR